MDDKVNIELPVAGYKPQSDVKVALVNEYKADEERLLRKLEELLAPSADGSSICDPRWVSIAKTHFQEGFMALNRSVFQPGRIALPEDSTQAAA
jgi:hypothetical protein